MEIIFTETSVRAEEICNSHSLPQVRIDVTTIERLGVSDETFNHAERGTNS